MREDNLISPVRTRGPIRTRDDERGGLAPAPVRTRGAIRTRGPAAAEPARIEAVRSLTVRELVSDLRAQVDGLPLTILLHGWGGEPAAAFLRTLDPVRRNEDALWFVPTVGGAGQLPATAVGVVLDRSHDTDDRVYRNLVSDIVFFPATDEAEKDEVATWRQRASAIVVGGLGPHASAVLWASCEAGLKTYRWLGDARLEECGPLT